MAISQIGTASISGLGYGFKNRIINGAMMIDQRNAGASFTPAGGGYLCDRWRFEASQASKFTAQQSTTAPSGFVNSQLLTSSSAYSVLTGDYFAVGQLIEGLNVSDLGWGAVGALPVTLSFWVRSSLTGTFGGAISNSAQSRSYPFSYTINSANTFEQKTVTIPGDTTGTWLTTNGTGVRVYFGLGVGTTYSGAAGAWAGAAYVSATGATSVVGTNAATFYITGVQLEVGTVATTFDYRPYGTELSLCQRYYYLLGRTTAYNWLGSAICADTQEAIYLTPAPVTMRTTPSFSTSGSLRSYNGATRAITSSSINVQATPSIPATSFVASGGGLAAGQGVGITANNDATAYIAYSAEL